MSALLFRWTGEAFVPASPYHAKQADQVYVVEEVYPLVEQSDRSSESHRHYFAAVREAWLQLPEPLAARFPKPEHLRKYALIRTGYYDSHSVVLDSSQDAERVAAFMQPIDEFGVVAVEGCTVTRFTAQSQSYRSMGKKTFQESKDRVLDFVADLIDVTRRDLERNTGRAA